MLKRIQTKEGYELISARQAAAHVGVTRNAIYNWVNEGRLSVMAVINDNVTLYDKKAVIAAAASCQKRKPRSGERKAKG